MPGSSAMRMRFTIRSASPRRLAGASLPRSSAHVSPRGALRIPVLIDGFVSTAAVAPLKKLRPDALDHALAGHMSAEAGHRLLLQELGLKPLLDLDMRLGEGSGAAVAVLVLRAALACHTGMATFAEAHISQKDA